MSCKPFLRLGIIMMLSCAPLAAFALSSPGDTQTGTASYYGKDFHGRRTASGKRFDMHGLTAAHKRLPLGARVRVTDQRTGKSVEVEINDRGPHSKGRIIDLSLGAARAIGLAKRGVSKVTVELLSIPKRRI